jgi:hypothetical protein
VSKIQLGRDLGAAIDIGPAMTRKILKQNGSAMYRSSVRSLTQDESQSPTEQKERQEFDIAIEEKFGPAMNKDDFQDDPDYTDFGTPTYDCYETTKVWHLCVEWQDGTTSWERMADLKEINPVEAAEYAATKSLLNTPAFIWWAPHVLQKRTRIMSAVTKRYHKRTHKFGIEVPKSWYDCVKLDKENDNTLWQDAVRK